MDPLTQSLLDLLYELRNRDLPLTVGGGFGLFLKRIHLVETAQRTLFDRLPSPRATNDLDLFIRAEILASLAQTRELADAIRRLGYEPVEEAKFFQWKRLLDVGGMSQEVKIDLLVGPLGEFRNQLQVKSPRVRPKGDIQFHAHCVEEALQIESNPVVITLDGQRTGGEPFQGTVFVPQAFPYLMMKLSAFCDRKNDARKDVGRHHALDAYTIVGMMTETEYDHARELGGAYADEPHVQDVRRIVAEDFSGPTAMGILRLLEHPLARPDFLIADFIAVLGEIFPAA
jgi:hypothetical protein